MSVLPDVVLTRAIANGIRAVREDTRVIDSLFRNLTQAQLDRVKKFIQETPIPMHVNYPKTDLKVPAIILILKSESEAQPFLGNHMGTSPDYGLPEEFSEDILGTYPAASTSAAAGLPAMVCGPLIVDTCLSNSVTIATGSQSELAKLLQSLKRYNSGNYGLYVVSGTGAGYSYPIYRITSDSIDIEGDFTVQLDNQSVVVIRDESSTADVVGEPSRVFNNNSVVQRLGVNYEAQYQLEILGSHQDEVLYLYSLIKAILISQTAFLEGQGLMALKLSGSDFAPKSDYLPTEVYMRTLTLQFTYPFSLVEQLTDVASRIDVKIYPNDTDEISIASFNV